MDKNNNNNDDFLESDEWFDGEKEPGCPYTREIMSAITSGKPFGMTWNNDIKEDFLRKKGYIILSRVSDSGEDYKVAVKPDEQLINDDGVCNFEKVFELEIQKILSKWLLTI